MKSITGKRPLSLLMVLLAALLSGCAQDAPTGLVRDQPLLVNRGSDGNLADGVRALLRLSVQRGTFDLAQINGYNRFDATRLPMPAAAEPAARFLRAWGTSRLLDPLLMDMNRGAEVAAGRFEATLQQRVVEMGIPNVRALMTGADTAASELLCAPREELLIAFAPVLKQALTDVGYFDTQDKVVREYNSIPVLDDIAPFDIAPELEQRALDGLCKRVAAQESRIRRLENERPDDAPDSAALRYLLTCPF